LSRAYLDSSVALHAVLPGGDPRARAWLDDAIRHGEEVFSSSLLELEVIRTLRREQLPLALSRPLLDRVQMISIDDGVLRHAATFESHIRSLDAIHLATALLVGTTMTVVTHDAAMLSVAADLGVPTADPLI